MRGKSEFRNGRCAGCFALFVLVLTFAAGAASSQQPAPASSPAPIVAVTPTPASGATPTTTPLRILATVQLPAPDTTGKTTLEQALVKRRSTRAFRREALPLEQLGQLLWAGQGVTERTRGLRTAPSAGATYPIEIYVATSDGHYHYAPREHRLERLGFKDIRSQVGEIAGGQKMLSDAGAVFILAADTRRTEAKFQERAGRYICFEAGHVAQNILLQAAALGLGGVPLGAFYEDNLKQLLGIPPEQLPLYTVAVGKPQ